MRSGVPCAVARRNPLAFSCRMTAQPASVSFVTWRSRLSRPERRISCPDSLATRWTCRSMATTGRGTRCYCGAMSGSPGASFSLPRCAQFRDPAAALPSHGSAFYNRHAFYQGITLMGDRDERARLVADQIVSDAAYFIWENEGRPEGKARDHWERAVLQIEGSDDGLPGRRRRSWPACRRTSLHS